MYAIYSTFGEVMYRGKAKARFVSVAILNQKLRSGVMFQRVGSFRQQTVRIPAESLRAMKKWEQLSDVANKAQLPFLKAISGTYPTNGRYFVQGTFGSLFDKDLTADEVRKFAFPEGYDSAKTERLLRAVTEESGVVDYDAAIDQKFAATKLKKKLELEAFYVDADDVGMF